MKTETIQMKDAEKLAGKYAVLFRDETKVTARIVGVDSTDKRVTYELLSGPDKGKRYSSRSDQSQIAVVYNTLPETN